MATLNGTRAVNDPDATNVAQVVLLGARRRTAQGEMVMPSFGHAYSDAEIAAVANYVTALRGEAIERDAETGREAAQGDLSALWPASADAGVET